MSVTVAIQYPSLGPNHPARLDAIVRAAPEGARVVAMEMFARDSDYLWEPVTAVGAWQRRTVLGCDSARGRRLSRELQQAVWSSLDDIAPDVLVVNGWGHAESRASLAWLHRHRRAWVLLSDSSRADRRRLRPLELYKRWLLRGCRAAFVAGSPQARYAIELGVPASSVFHPGSCVVDNELFKREATRARQQGGELRAGLGLPQRYFLSVARWIAKKNLPFLVRAWDRFRSRPGAEPFGLVLCGSGPEEARIRDEVARARHQGVALVPFQPPARLAVLYGLASCFVLASSHFEQWGLVVNEAMASGLPVLVSRVCGAAEDLVREGENGFTFDPGDVERLAEMMCRLAAAHDLAVRMGAVSARIVEDHSCEVGAVNLWRAVEAAQR